MAKLYFKQSKQKKIMRSLSQDPVLWNLVKIICACASFCWGKIYQVLSFTRGQSYKTYAKFSERAESCSVIKKEILAQAFSCEFWEILTTPFLQNTPRSLLLNLQILYFKLYRSKHAKIKPNFYTV